MAYYVPMKHCIKSKMKVHLPFGWFCLAPEYVIIVIDGYTYICNPGSVPPSDSYIRRYIFCNIYVGKGGLYLGSGISRGYSIRNILYANITVKLYT